MEMEDVMKFLTLEADRLEQLGLARSSYSFSTLTAENRIGRLTIIVTLEDIPAQAAPQPQAPPAPQRPTGMPTGMPQQGAQQQPQQR
jgi:hypothetical protein